MKPNHLLFVQHYLKNGGNGTQAAIASGCPVKGAATTANRWLKRADVSGLLLAHSSKIEKTAVITAEKVLAELGKIAFGNMQDLFDSHGNLLPINELPRDVAATLIAFENDKGFKKVKMASKLDALGTLAKILNLVKPDEQSKVQVIVLPPPVGALVGQPDPQLPAPVTLLLKPEW